MNLLFSRDKNDTEDIYDWHIYEAMLTEVDKWK